MQKIVKDMQDLRVLQVLHLLVQKNGKDSSTAGRNLVGSHGQLHPPAC